MTDGPVDVSRRSLLQSGSAACCFGAVGCLDRGRSGTPTQPPESPTGATPTQAPGLGTIE